MSSQNPNPSDHSQGVECCSFHDIPRLFILTAGSIVPGLYPHHGSASGICINTFIVWDHYVSQNVIDAFMEARCSQEHPAHLMFIE